MVDIVQTMLYEDFGKNKPNEKSSHLGIDNFVDDQTLTELTIAVYSKLLKRKRKKPKKVTLHVEFYSYTNIKLTARKRNRTLYIRLSDILRDAPMDVLEAALSNILSQYLGLKVSEKDRVSYRDYIYSKPIRTKRRNVRQTRATKHLTQPKGKSFDLEKIFEIINEQYFDGGVPKPKLSWSLRKSKRRLGHFDPDLNTLVVSKRLDAKTTPNFVIEYIVYHELLHSRYPGKYLNGRWVVHSSAFKHEEKSFKKYRQAIDWIRNEKY